MRKKENVWRLRIPMVILSLVLLGVSAALVNSYSNRGVTLFPSEDAGPGC